MSETRASSPSSNGLMSTTAASKTNGHSGHEPVAEPPEESGQPDVLGGESEVLRRSEAALRDFIETATVGLHWVGADGTILWANQAELDLMGYGRDEYFGRHIAEFHADTPVIEDILTLLTRGDTLKDYPARLLCRNGSIRYVLISSSALFEDGKFIHTRCLTRDVTRERQAEEQVSLLHEQLNAELAGMMRLQELSTRLAGTMDFPSLLQEILDAAIQVTGTDKGIIQLVEDASGTLKILGSRGFDGEFLEFFNAVHEGLAACGHAMQKRERVIVEDVAFSPLFVGTRAGEIMLAAQARGVQSTPLIGRSGQILGMLSTYYSAPQQPSERQLRLLDFLARLAADSIERAQADLKFRDAEKRYRELFEALPAAVYTTDEAGRITSFNQAAVEFSGRIPEIGTDSWCVSLKLYQTDGTPLPHDRCPMAVALKEKRAVRGCEAIAERADGERRNFIPFPTPLFDASGKLTGAINMLVDITERKRAEVALRESEERFKAIVETTPECVKVIAPDGTILHMNASGLVMVGAPYPEAVIGKNIYDLIAPEFREVFRDFNQRVCSGEKGALEFDITGLAGQRRHMETHAAPFPGPNGGFVQLGITRDITERRKADRATRLLGAIVDSSDDAIVSKDLTGTISSWNKSAERVFGYTAEEAVGKSVTMLIPSDRLEEEPDILARLQKGQRVDHFETIRRKKDGTLINVSLTISPVRDSAGKIVGASKIARDITEQKRVEAALQESEGRFRQLADSMPQIVWTSRPDGYRDYYNERWYEFTGLPRDVFGDAGFEPVVHPDDAVRWRETWYSCVKSGQAYRLEIRLRDRHNNGWRWFMGRALPVRDEGGTIVKWFGTCTDIDGQKRVEEELRRANQDLEQFAYSASHDLQEPLRSIKIYGQLLASRHAEKLDGEAQEFLGFVTAGATRMELLVRDLLAYTQVTKLGAPEDPTDANEALAESLADLEAALASSGAEVTSDPLPSVCVHATHLKQLFQNLIGNAIKYRSPERKAQVHVSAQQQNGSWIFAVRDNGIGIEPEYKEQIFGLFTRLHTGAEFPGTGIGLAICQRIVERYHGRIWVESEPGQGSTFRFSIPV
jgi:PAS domain S-box-containing protein